jgi:hypothetical protein
MPPAADCGVVVGCREGETEDAAAATRTGRSCGVDRSVTGRGSTGDGVATGVAEARGAPFPKGIRGVETGVAARPMFEIGVGMAVAGCTADCG